MSMLTLKVVSSPVVAELPLLPGVTISLPPQVLLLPLLYKSLNGSSAEQLAKVTTDAKSIILIIEFFITLFVFNYFWLQK